MALSLKAMVRGSARRDGSAGRGRPPVEVNLVLADDLRRTGLSWVEIAKELGVDRNTLLARRQESGESGLMRRDWKSSPPSAPIPRAFLPKEQARLLRAASRFLKANLGEGLTPVEFREAKDLVAWLTTLHKENAALRDALAKAKVQLRDYERMLRR